MVPCSIVIDMKDNDVLGDEGLEFWQNWSWEIGGGGIFLLLLRSTCEYVDPAV